MEIFNVEIFGEDKEQWLKQSPEEKVEWIRKYTNQQDDAIIEEFVNNPKISKDKICLTCGDKTNYSKAKNIEVIDEVVIDENPIEQEVIKEKKPRKK